EIVELELKLAALRAKAVALDLEGVWDERVPASTIMVQEATAPDEIVTMRTFGILVVANALGIGAAHFAHVGVFAPLFTALGHGSISVPTDYLLTGLFIGGGSGPAHLLIRFISDRAVPMPPEPVKTATSIPKGIVASDSASAAEVAVRATSLPASTITPAGFT